MSRGRIGPAGAAKEATAVGPALSRDTRTGSGTGRILRFLQPALVD